MKIYKLKVPVFITSISEVVFPKLDSERDPTYEEVHEDDAFITFVIKASSSKDALNKFADEFSKALTVGKELG